MPASMISIGGISGADQAEVNAKRAEEKLAYQKNRKKWAEKLGDLEKEKENKEKELEKIKELTKKTCRRRIGRISYRGSFGRKR